VEPLGGGSIHEYPSLSLAEALESDDFVHRALAMLDRRLGQRRLASLELRADEHPLVSQLLEFRRRGVDRLRCLARVGQAKVSTLPESFFWVR
jgi:hypothetical protein